MPAVAVGSAVSAMAAQNIGAGNWSRLPRVAWAGIGINVAMSVTLLGAMTLGIHPLLSAFLPHSGAATAIAVHMNLLVGWTFIAIGISMVVGSVMRANGAVIGPFVILILSAVVMRFAVGFWLHPYWGADAIWAAFGSSAVTSLLLTLAYYWHGGWKSSRMVPA
jgi:Na+-driven multidrug efflux pump